MKIRKFYTYLADLNPRRGTEPGKIRPVVVVQTDLLNDVHPSTDVCPITSRLTEGVKVLRVRVLKGSSGLEKDSDVLADQIRAIDNRRFIKQIGRLSKQERGRLLRSLRVIVLE